VAREMSDIIFGLPPWPERWLSIHPSPQPGSLFMVVLCLLANENLWLIDAVMRCYSGPNGKQMIAEPNKVSMAN